MGTSQYQVFHVVRMPAQNYEICLQEKGYQESQSRLAHSGYAASYIEGSHTPHSMHFQLHGNWQLENTLCNL